MEKKEVKIIALGQASNNEYKNDLFKTELEIDEIEENTLLSMLEFLSDLQSLLENYPLDYK